jgi:CO dehydrogenase maturation factor
MKLAISGKGGVGKTTLSGLLAVELVGRGYRVTAIDADPNPTLAAALGIPPGTVPSLLDMREEIEARVGGSDGYIRLNPRVDDLVDRLIVAHRGVQVIVAGAISRGGGGCACPQSVLLRRLLDHLVLDRDEAIIVDLEAGLEHLGRRSAQAADALLVVVDPSRGSLDTAGRIRRLAAEIGIAQVLAVANRIHEASDEAYIAAHLDGIPLVGSIPYSTALADAERYGAEAAGGDPAVARAVARLTDELESRCGRRVRT